MKTLEIPIPLWLGMVNELKIRGAGERESGAFLLGAPDSGCATQFVCYDDLDPRALESGIITFHASGFVRLWDLCQQSGLQVLADAHTHPTRWTLQSESDRTHPMVASPGHFALILPHYAQRLRGSLRGVGIYEYLGDHRWRKCHSIRGSVKLTQNENNY